MKLAASGQKLSKKERREQYWQDQIRAMEKKKPGFDASGEHCKECGMCHKLITIGQRVYYYTTKDLAHVTCGVGEVAPTSPIKPTVRLGKGSGRFGEKPRPTGSTPNMNGFHPNGVGYHRI